MLEIYLSPFTVNSRKVLAALILLGTECKVNNIDFENDEHKGAKYLQINPMGTVPAAIDGDLRIFESNAILQYISEGQPIDAKQRARISTWLFWESSAWFPACYVFLTENVFKPIEDLDRNALDKVTPRWKELASVLEAQLAKTKWVTGYHVTVADLAIAAPMHGGERQKLPLDGFPNLKHWFHEGIMQLPCWQKTQGAVDEAMESE